MHPILLLLAALAGPGFQQASSQDDWYRKASLRDERSDDPRPDRWPTRAAELEGIPRDLWYGTPGARPGGDLLGPVIEIIRRPSNLLDFRPRRVQSFLPDRETMEFLRDRR